MSTENEQVISTARLRQDHTYRIFVFRGGFYLLLTQGHLEWFITQPPYDCLYVLRESLCVITHGKRIRVGSKNRWQTANPVAKIAARKLQKKHPHARDIFCPEHDTTPVIHH